LTALEQAQVAGARLQAACKVIGISVRTIQRWRRQNIGYDRRIGPKHSPANALSEMERRRLLRVINSPKYRGFSPKQIVPMLADEGVYLASESTIYRLLRQCGQLKHRVSSRPPVERAKPRQTASGPNQLWSWDITFLKSTVRGRFYYLYLIMDVWSRKIVGWSVHKSQNSKNASTLITESCITERVKPDQLVLHSDNGTPMHGATMLATLQWLGVVPSFSRPHVYDDNAYSETLFRTLKYRPTYPRRPFADIAEAQAWVKDFVKWYNKEHRHSGISFVTPDERHTGQHRSLISKRMQVYERARKANPERWSRRIRIWDPIEIVCLNADAQARQEKAA
jgi:transposase InsO family protein